MADRPGSPQTTLSLEAVNAVAGPSRSPVDDPPKAHDPPAPPAMARSTTGDDILGIPSLPAGDEPNEQDVPVELDVPEDFVDRADDFDMRTSMYVRAFEGACRLGPSAGAPLCPCDPPCRLVLSCPLFVALTDMLETVLASESYLFSELELATFSRYRALSCASFATSPQAARGPTILPHLS